MCVFLKLIPSKFIGFLPADLSFGYLQSTILLFIVIIHNWWENWLLVDIIKLCTTYDGTLKWSLFFKRTFCFYSHMWTIELCENLRIFPLHFTFRSPQRKKVSKFNVLRKDQGSIIVTSPSTKQRQITYNTLNSSRTFVNFK